MALAAEEHGVAPRTISFKGTMQTLEMFQPLIAYTGSISRYRQAHHQELLIAIVAHWVADRPDRIEPRQKKRRRMR